jgi:hypothetical protein
MHNKIRARSESEERLKACDNVVAFFILQSQFKWDDVPNLLKYNSAQANRKIYVK